MVVKEFGALAGWAFLPHFASKIVLEVYYGFFNKHRAKPQPGTPLFVKHYRRVHAALVVGYLMLTIYDAYTQIRHNADFYQALGVSHDATDRAIKSKFRRLAAQFHPDKQLAGGPAPPENVFVALRIAQETLLNPVKRFAYDRFGPTMLKWEHCVSIKDYLHAGFQFYSPSYIGAGLMTLALSAMGHLDWGKYWRYLGGGTMILLEFYTLTRPEFPGFLTSVINPILSKLPGQEPLLPFQMLELARKVALAVSIAISQLGGSSAHDRSGYNEVDEQRLARLEFLSAMTEMDATRLLRMELAPFGDDKKALQTLKSRMTDWLYNNTIRADPVVRQAISQVMESDTKNEELSKKDSQAQAQSQAIEGENQPNEQETATLVHPDP